MHTTQALFEQTDWSATELGSAASWPIKLRGYVSMIMEMPWPAIIFWGPSQRQIYNEGYAVIMGPRHPRYFGGTYRDCWPDTYPAIYPWMRKVLDHGEVIEVQRTHIPLTRFGFDEEAYFTFIFSPLRDDEGRIAGILQPVFEVTTEVLAARRADLLRAVSAAQREEDPLPKLVEAIGACRRDIPFASIWLHELDDTLSLASCVGSDALSGDVPSRLEAAAREVLTMNRAVVIDHLGVPAMAENGEVPVVNQALLLPIDADANGDRRGVVALGISARLHFDDPYRQFLEQLAQQVGASLRHAAAIREMERRRGYLNELFLQAPAGIALLAGPDHVFELVNPIYRSMIHGRDVVGRPLREALPELKGQPFPGILDDVYRTGMPYVGREMPSRLDAGDGQTQETVFTFLYQPMRDAHGAVTGILVMCYDVTDQVQERKRAEALTLELRQEHKRKDEFLAMLAHELRNPLAPLSSAAEILRRGPDAQRLQWVSQIIGRQVEHMAGLLDDLLDVSRVTRGLVEIERERVDLKSIVAEAGEQVRPLLEARHHRFLVDVPPGPVHVRGDRKRLVQVLANLLNNAAKYTPENGTVSVEVGIDGHQARMAVRDDGIGIPPELLPRVFELFVQAERSRDRSQGGLGIGLALVKTLVQLHGGSVAVASRGQDRGSQFTVLLPLDSELVSATQAAREGQTGSAAVRRRRILVVDDNIDAAQTQALLLESLGHDVMVAHGGQAALELAKSQLPDVSLLDIGLPGMDGYQLAEQLRRLPGAASVLLVAVSGYGQDADKQRAVTAGFDRYIVKPLDPKDLPELFGR